MARKDVLPGWSMFSTTGADMSTASTTSAVTGVNLSDNIGIIATWSGTSPVGAISFEVSNDYNAATNTAGTWVALDFGGAISVSGNTGTHNININQLPFSYLRGKYTKTSGTGTLNMYLTSKQVGG